MAGTPLASYSAAVGQKYNQQEAGTGQERAQSNSSKEKTRKQTKEAGHKKLSREEKTPSNACVDEFMKAFKGSKDQQTGHGKEQDDAQKQESPAELFAGMTETIFSSRMGQHSEAGKAYLQNQQVDSQVKLTPDIQKIAQQILVRAPKDGSQADVIIRLDHRSLPDTAVKISFEQSGLVVQFNTRNVNAHQTLVEHQFALKEKLEIENPGVRVVVNDQTASDGRSKGLLNFDQEEDE
ncbi:type III secretion HpaP family protein [Halodesulfovibrio marinisediminis]|uniref:Type III secretion protein (HpaP) n=1 Tax=Halodesulfovibrio marinisediminis DSM 17456 TaxID=1121457 RepID=A0A1N6I8Z4_9BACT|nr:type III secretion HpaP family protein [Halodesulfovibrio marinisediminis]SIO28435.1 Type III secretion protein (HpaP) [Halodesulfovibrio marinisediminis DSM 17456]